MGQGFDPWTPPRAPGSSLGGPQPGPRDSRPAIVAAVLVAIAALAGVAAVVLVNRGGTASTASSVTQPRDNTTVPHHPTSQPLVLPIVSNAALADLGVQPGDLGVNWADEGISAYSEDLSSPPPDCAPYARALTTREGGAVHEYTFNPHDGYDDGGLASTVIYNASRAAVAAELPAVRTGAFTACAEATAQEWLANNDGSVTVLGLHAAPIHIVAAPNVAGWRATVDYSNAAGRATFGLDIFYVSAGNYLAKIRVALCPCQPQPEANLALVPDEVQAVTDVSGRITAAAGEKTPSSVPSEVPPVTVPVPALALADPCQLLTPAQVRAVIGATRPPARITVGDEANECTWIGSDGKSIAIQSGDSSVQFQTRLRDTPQPLAGLGDQAGVDPEFAGKVVVRRGNTWIEVFVEGTTSDRANAINLARVVLPKL